MFLIQIPYLGSISHVMRNQNNDQFIIICHTMHLQYYEKIIEPELLLAIDIANEWSAPQSE